MKKFECKLCTYIFLWAVLGQEFIVNLMAISRKGDEKAFGISNFWPSRKTRTKRVLEKNILGM